MKPGRKTKPLSTIYDKLPSQLSEYEIKRLDMQSRAWVRHWQMRRLRQRSCPLHERMLIGNEGGWHRVCCRHCGIDMSGGPQ